MLSGLLGDLSPMHIHQKRAWWELQETGELLWPDLPPASCVVRTSSCSSRGLCWLISNESPFSATLATAPNTASDGGKLEQTFLCPTTSVSCSFLIPMLFRYLLAVHTCLRGHWARFSCIKMRVTTSCLQSAGILGEGDILLFLVSVQ